jgi:hypothetical protein
LFQQYRPDELEDIGVIVEGCELRLDALVLLLLRFEFLARIDKAVKLC